MSGHSKWSKVKHQKAATDAARGKIFTKLSNAITIAVKQGGGIADPESNFRLRLAIDKARAVNMPKENIERAISKAQGGSNSSDIHESVYEAYGPSGVGLIIEAATDNKQRTVSEIKNILDKNGGSLVASGSVMYLFDHVGMILLDKGSATYDSVFEKALEMNVLDVVDLDQEVEVYTLPSELHNVKSALAKVYKVTFSELVFRPKNSIKLQNQQDSMKVYALMEKLEENDDVQKVHTNAEFPSDFSPVP